MEFCSITTSYSRHYRCCHYYYFVVVVDVIVIVVVIIIIISDPRRGCFMGLSMFIFIYFFFLSATILSGPYLWNRYLQRLQIQCAAWSCGLVLHYCLTTNSLRYFFYLFFFSATICPGHISGTVTRRDSKLSVLLGPAV